MKRYLIVLVYFSFTLLFFVFGCNQENLDLQSLTLKEKININVDNDKMHDFAKILATSMDKDFGRDFIKQKALEQFDNDYDILLAKVLNENIFEPGNKQLTFSEFLENHILQSDIQMKSEINFDKFLNSLLSEYPLLQISIPEVYENSTEGWNIYEELPLIAVLPDNYDENNTQVIPAYDVNKNIYYLDVNVLPNRPVIVIGQNERLIVYKKANFDKKMLKNVVDECSEFYYSTNEYEYYLPVDCGGGEYSNDPGNNAIYDRDLKDSKDILNKATFVDKSAFRRVEKWPQGRPEFKVIISYIEKEGSNYNTKTITKILTKSGWMDRYVFWVNLKTKQIDLPIITWNRTVIGNSMKYTWIEQDNSDTKTELSIAVSSKFGDDNLTTTITGTTKITISAEDDEAGEAIVEYKDKTAGEGTEYNTGIVKFWINQ